MNPQPIDPFVKGSNPRLRTGASALRRVQLWLPPGSQNDESRRLRQQRAALMRCTDALHERPRGLVLESTLMRTRRTRGGPVGRPHQLRLARHRDSSIPFTAGAAVTKFEERPQGPANGFRRRPAPRYGSRHVGTAECRVRRPWRSSPQRDPALGRRQRRTRHRHRGHRRPRRDGCLHRAARWVLGVERHRED